MRTFLLAVALVALSAPLSAQFFSFLQHDIEVPVPHPPGLDVTVKRVAFAETAGPCSDVFADKIENALVSGNIDVVDRQHLDQIFAELHLDVSAAADPKTSAQLGRIMGAAALIFVRVDECGPARSQTYNTFQGKNGKSYTTYYSKTSFRLEASVKTVDVSTGRVLAAEPLHAIQERQNSSSQGYPEYPPADPLRDMATSDLATQVAHLFLPWTEQVKLPFYASKTCGLKDEYRLFHNGDQQGALQLSLSNLAQCKAARRIKEKSIAQAYYDAGLINLAEGAYQPAEGYLQRAMDLKGANAAGRAASVTRQAESGAKDVAQYRQRASHITALPTLAVPPQQASQPTAVLVRTPAPSAASASQPKAPKLSVVQRMEELNELYKKGLIGRKEYEVKKAEILKSL